jgi:NH3-dependent NAD+ synthetase
MGLPESIRTKAPSADLWIGQTDEGELGYTYAEVDKLLYLLVDERYSPDECVQAGFATLPSTITSLTSVYRFGSSTDHNRAPLTANVCRTIPPDADVST